LRLLFDENVPKRLRRLLPGHEISTAQERGWGGIVNGKLLHAAEAAGFDVMLTADQNIVYQQNLAERVIALVVLSTNDWSVLKHASAQIAAAVDAAKPKTYQTVTVPQPNPR
jgi:predicted nuclease of predicted toxin-antitoxin system